MINKKFLHFAFDSAFFQTIFNKIKIILKLVRKASKKKPKIFERFQLTSIYFFAVVVLAYSIKNSLGYFPELLTLIFPFFDKIFDIKALKILVAPEKTFLLYLVILEICLNRSSFNFSLLIKFNVLLIFLLEMLQNLLISFWDLFINRELEVFDGGMAAIMKNITVAFYSLLFLFFFALYLYSYVVSLKGHLPIYSGLLKYVTDSVAFWLQIKRLNDHDEKKTK